MNRLSSKFLPDWQYFSVSAEKRPVGPDPGDLSTLVNARADVLVARSGAARAAITGIAAAESTSQRPGIDWESVVRPATDFAGRYGSAGQPGVDRARGPGIRKPRADFVGVPHRQVGISIGFDDPPECHPSPRCVAQRIHPADASPADRRDRGALMNACRPLPPAPCCQPASR